MFKFNRKFFSLMLIISATIFAQSLSFAELSDFDGGITMNQTLKSGVYEYREISFISGEPILLKGTVAISSGNKENDTYPLTFSYSLYNDDKAASLERKVSYIVEQTKDVDSNKVTADFKLSNLSETYVIGGNTYTLASKQFDKSRYIDKTAAVRYFSGSLFSTRVFYINGNERSNSGTVTIKTSSLDNVGYEHLWGNNESMVAEQVYTYESAPAKTEKPGETPPATSGTTMGTATIRMSTLEKTEFTYNSTKPQNISFKGNYIQKTLRDCVLSYEYDMPKADNKRLKGKNSIKYSAPVKAKSLIAPSARDIWGAKSEKNMLFALSIKLFPDTKFFNPRVEITRIDFIKALVSAMSDIKPLTTAELIKRNRPGVEPLVKFQDIKADSPDITYLEYAINNRIIANTSKYFYPDRPITRQEAITFTIRALGLTSMAPTPPYKTKYTDDKKINIVSKDSVYAAYEIGLDRGYSNKTFRPRNTMTRAEASTLLNNLVNHITKKIIPDYRERLIN